MSKMNLGDVISVRLSKPASDIISREAESRYMAKSTLVRALVEAYIAKEGIDDVFNAKRQKTATSR